ncbi:MAG: hypothetical protein ACM3TR_09930 [Caulobacteraceae bacterium]
MAKASVILKCTECGASYTITKSCYNRTEANKWESYMQDRDGLCRECWAKEQEAKRQAVMDACKSLPDLTGTPKQIAWAEKIRADKHNMFKGRGFTYIANETSAAWWIDHRNDVESEIYNRFQVAQKQQATAKALSMTKSDIFKRAHQLAKQLKADYPDTDYRTNFAESLRALYAAIKAVKVSA